MGADRLVVVYDTGAASLHEVLRSLRALGTIIFVVPDNAHVRAVMPMLRAGGQVVVLGTDVAATATELRGLDPTGIVTFSEPMVALTARLAACLDLPYHSAETVRLLTDKYLQRKHLNAAGVSSVATFRLRSADQWPEAVATLGLPVVVKPVVGVASRNTYLVSDARQGQHLAERLLGGAESELVVEEFLPGRPSGDFGDYASVETVCSEGRTVHLAVTGKFRLVTPFREAGQLWPPPAISRSDRAAALEVAARAVDALGIRHGAVHTELKWTPAGPQVIEVNGRLGGHINELAIRSVGYDLVWSCGRLAIGSHAGEEMAAAACAADRIRNLTEVFFQYMSAAPCDARRLVAVDGAREVRRAPGIDGYLQYVRPGIDLDPVRTMPLDLLCGRADVAEHVFGVVDTALERLTLTFDMAGGRWQGSGRQLRHAVG